MTVALPLAVTLVGSGTIGEILPGWSVTEDITPVAPGDTSGGTGSVGFSARQGVDSEFIIDNLLTLTHDNLGTVTGGKVATLGSAGASEETDTIVSATGTTGLGLLAVDRTWPGTGEFVPIHDWAFTGFTVRMDYLSNGNIVVASNSPIGSASIRVYTPQGVLVGSAFYNDDVNDIAVNRTNDRIYVLQSTNYDVLSSTGSVISSNNGSFTLGVGIAIDSAGNIYVLDASTFLVKKYNSSNALQTSWGGSGSGQNLYLNPKDITVDDEDRIYVSDNYSIQKSNNTGGWITAYTPTGTAAYGSTYHISEINQPTLMNWVNGSLYVQDGVEQIHAIDTDSHLARHPLPDPDFDVAVGAAGLLASPTGIYRSLGTGLLSTGVMHRYYPGQVQGLSDAFRSILKSIDASPVTYSASTDPPVILPGFSGEVWDHLKQLCSAFGVEFAPVGSARIVRDLGTAVLDLDSLIEDGFVKPGSVSLSLDSQATGRSVDFVDYESALGYGTIYDAYDSNTLHQVASGEVSVIDIQTDNYPTTLNRPSVIAAGDLPTI